MHKMQRALYCKKTENKKKLYILTEVRYTNDSVSFIARKGGVCTRSIELMLFLELLNLYGSWARERHIQRREFAYGKQLMYYLKGLEPFAANCCTLQRFNKRKTETKNIANAYYDTKSIKW